MTFSKYLNSTAIICLLFVTACDNDNTISDIDFTEIVSGNTTLDGSLANKKIEVFTDQASLNASLALYINLVTEHDVDFTTRRAVLLSMGGRNTGGYSIAAEAIEDHTDYIKLKVLLSKPGDNCFTTQALTSPYQFIEFQSLKEPLFEERVEVIDCN